MSIQEKYALTDEGLRNVKLGAVWTAASNLVVFGGVGALYLVMSELVAHLTEGAPLPNLLPYAAGLAAFAVALFVAEYWAYYYQYGVIYKESGRQRITLAERLRKLPLGFFGRRDLADLTETLMTDVKTTEHAYSHVLPELYGAYITLAVAAICLFSFDWRLALASLWSCPVGLAILFGARRALQPMMEATRMRGLATSEDIQEALECVREVRATNQEGRYLEHIHADVDAAERQAARSEIACGIAVNGAQIVLRLGLATTVLVGATLILEGSCTFMTLFAFLVVVSRIYAPFDQCLMLIAELFSAKTAAARMKSFYFYTPLSQIILFCILGLVCSVLLSVLIASKANQPIRRLLFEAGPSSRSPDVDAENEVDYLSKTYSYTTRQNEELSQAIQSITPLVLERLFGHLLSGRPLSEEHSSSILSGIGNPFPQEATFFGHGSHNLQQFSQ